MKAVILALLMASQILSLNPAFQSIVSPRPVSSFSSYSFNVINPGYYQIPNVPTYISPFSYNRIVYVSPTPYSGQQFSLPDFFSNSFSYSTSPSVPSLSKFRRNPNGSLNNLLNPAYNQA